MPLVRSRTALEFPAAKLEIACGEIVPAALNSPQGPAGPGSVIFTQDLIGPYDALGADALVEVYANRFPDREVNLDARTHLLRNALEELFPGTSFVVVIWLVIAGWDTPIGERPFEGDRSMPAALERAKMQIASDHLE